MGSWWILLARKEAFMTDRNFTEAEFLSFLEGQRARVQEAQKVTMEVAANTLLKDARSTVGTYQREDMGPLPPWAALADSTKDDRVRQGYPENEPGLRSGEMRDSYQTRVPDAHHIVLGSNDPKAVFFENGTVKQPPRPVIATALFRKHHDITRQIAKSLTRAIGGGNIFTSANDASDPET
ncbi:hypothetical protein MSKU15_1431 [Komagataeibacter diospyri]|nr:hypothetical protein MSKU15_1431 [Komagataeibacter diospyri]